jgi:hypothetical protein
LARTNKKFWKGEDRDTGRLKDWFRTICAKAGYNCETERCFTVNFHDTNELADNKEIPYPVDIYISHRRKPYHAIVEIDGLYHDETEQQKKDAKRDAAITVRYRIPIYRYRKEDLLSGKVTEQDIISKLRI